jgi:hypothetical protein
MATRVEDIFPVGETVRRALDPVTGQPIPTITQSGGTSILGAIGQSFGNLFGGILSGVNRSTGAASTPPYFPTSPTSPPSYPAGGYVVPQGSTSPIGVTGTGYAIPYPVSQPKTDWTPYILAGGAAVAVLAILAAARR